VQREEQLLGAALERASAEMDRAIGREEFAYAMGTLAGLRVAVDAFFDQVTVNADDATLRANRLRLLSAIQATMARVADFSKVEGG
jgi:glycyl-tRNA synthetase beta chain